MALTEGIPQVVQDNLSFCIDPQNYRSYTESGTDVTDVSANNETTTLTSGAGWSSGEFTLDGVNDNIEADGLATTVTADTNGSFETWVKHNGSPSGAQNYMVFADTSAATFIRSYISAGIIYFDSRDSGVNKWRVQSDSSSLISGDTWHHLVCTFDAATPTIYLDGSAPAQTVSITTDLTYWLGDTALIDNFRLGHLDWSGTGAIQHFYGSFGACRYYSSALSSAQVLQNYNATKDIYL